MSAGELLNEKQRKFCENFVVCNNATVSYQDIYPECSYNSARASAARLLTDVNILAYIEEFKDTISAKQSLALQHIYDERLTTIKEGYLVASEMRRCGMSVMVNSKVKNDNGEFVYKINDRMMSAVARIIQASAIVSRQNAEEQETLTGIDVLARDLAKRIKSGKYSEQEIMDYVSNQK